MKEINPRLAILALVLPIFLLNACAFSPPDSRLLQYSTPDKQVCVSRKEQGFLNVGLIQVTSWNMLKGKREGWSLEFEQLNRSDKLFLVQEAPKAQLVDQVFGEQVWDFAPGYRTGDGETGVLTAAGVESTLSCQLTHREPWLRTAKATLVTRYPIMGLQQQLLVANIHAVNFTFGTSDFSKQLQDLFNILNLHDGPIILAGDFNAWNSARTEILESYVSSLELETVAFDSNLVKKFAGYPLDFVFYRGLSIEDQSVKEVVSSDHNMLQVRFSL